MATVLKQSGAPGHKSQEKRRPRRAALLFCGLLLASGALGAMRLGAAWQETRLREAYLPQLEAMAQQSPADGRLLALLGGRLVEAGEYPIAVETFRRAIAAGAENDTVWLTLAAARSAGGDLRGAGADFALAQRSLPQSPALQVAAIRLRTLGKKPPPAAVAQAFCPQGPSSLIASVAGGSFLDGPTAWWERRHPETSGFATREAWAERSPNDAQAQRLWGLALERNRRLPEAAMVLTRAVTLAPHSPLANLAVADLMAQTRMDSKAVLGYVTCLQLRPDWPPALLGLGQAALRAGMTRYALQSYKRATEVAPGSADAWIGLGRAGAALWTHHAQSLAAFETAARLNPERTDFYADYAAALRQDGVLNVGGRDRLTMATTILRRRLVAAPDDAASHFLLGGALLSSSPSPATESEAEAQTRRALALAPGQPQAQIQLAKILLGRGDSQRAVELLTSALASDPSSAPAMTLLAQAYGRSGLAERAAQATLKARQLNDRADRLHTLQDREETNLLDPALHEELAALYKQRGQDDKARAEQEAARLIRENPQQAAAQLKAIQGDVGTVLKTH